MFTSSKKRAGHVFSYYHKNYDLPESRQYKFDYIGTGILSQNPVTMFRNIQADCINRINLCSGSRSRNFI